VIFDDFVAIANKFCPDLKQYLRKARLFHFPAYAREFVPTEISDEEVMFLRDSFFLPFPCISVEDKTSCVLIWDEKHKKGETPTGINRKRFFAECLPSGIADPLAFMEGEEDLIKRAQKQESLRGTFLITWGFVDQFHVVDNKGELVAGRLQGGILATKDEILADTKTLDPLTKKGMNDGFLRNAKTALEEVTFMNSPSRFVLEKRPLHVTPHKNPKRILKSRERPVYTLLTPKEIRTEMRLALPSSGGPRSPHERRRHIRKYQDARFSEKVRNKTYIIPATWVGPSVNEFEGHRYKVMLDI